MAGSPIVYVPNHTQPRARQQRRRTGCIPTACEWLVRYHGQATAQVDLIQAHCDLDIGKHLDCGDLPANNFRSVTAAVGVLLGAAAPAFVVEGDDPRMPMDGAGKVRRIEALIANKRPCVIPYQGPRGFHALAVVGDDAANGEFRVLLMQGDAPTDEIALRKRDVEAQQSRRMGGQEILFVAPAGRRLAEAGA